MNRTRVVEKVLGLVAGAGPLLLGSLALGPLLLALHVGCVPGSGSVEQPRRDGALAPDGPKLTLVDGALRHDTGGQPPRQDTGAPKVDTYHPPQPDVGPTGPTPPFGSSVGLTAANFSGIPDCNGTIHDLHAKFMKQPALVLLLNKGS